MMLPASLPQGPIAPDATGRDPPGDDVERLRRVARELEASFLSEMLKQAGFGAGRGTLGGGAGEEQFGSFLRAEHARALAERGGIGLAEQLFEALVARTRGTDPA
ncbi:rod-binding protein [Roseicyclus marinus]|uniref:rod-binding protein n=1 Tax=Roseicyclus marinus TaxID=2161673 RepID=UPI00240F6ADC|nr:rod-binding protein [Roseicyclus marinus]MDG3041346.1 rod-binding protein [Roseicyclus marinus]